MSGLHLHLLDARGALSTLRDWVCTTLTTTHDKAAAHLPLGPLDAVVQAGRHVIPEKGHVGHAPGPGVIFVTLDPDNSALHADASQSLARMFAHELHHAARWDGPGYGRSLGEALVSEGLAGCFVREMFGPPPEPWEALPLATIRAHISHAAQHWNDHSYDHAAWFFGSGDLPRWLGYSLGTALVAHHITLHPGTDAANLAHAPADTFRPSLDTL